MTPALSLPFPCIKQSTKQRQAKGQQGCHFGAKETVCRSAPRTTSPWGSPRAVAAPAHRPGWTVALSSFGDAVPYHGPSPWIPPLSCTLPPPSSLCGIPSRQDIWGMRTRTPIKGGGARLGKGLDFWFSTWLVSRSRVSAIVRHPELSKLSLYCNPLQAVQYTTSRT